MPDDHDARLVVLSADHPYSREAGNAAETAAKAILESRGSGPRLYWNTLVFLAADKVRLQDLDDALSRFLAWDSIVDEKVELNLDAHQARQAEQQRQGADSAVTARLPETYQWLLAPEQQNPKAPLAWQAIRLTGSDALAVRASRKLENEELLVSSLGSTILRKHLDEVPLWRGDHITVRQLVEDFAMYPYLPRLTGPGVLLQAIRDGVALLTWQTDTFAYAESHDEAAGRYRGLRGGQVVTVTGGSSGLIVRPGVAQRQLDEAMTTTSASGAVGSSSTSSGRSPSPGAGDGPSVSGDGGGRVAAPPAPRRYYGVVRLDPTRVGRDAGRIADEVISHLVGQVNAEVTVTLEIQASLPGGASEQIVRIVTENSRALKFTSHGFEAE